MKRNLFKSFLIFLVLFFSINNKSFAAEKSFTIDQLNINAIILPNGDINITEQLKYNFSGDFNGIYRDYNLEGSNGCQINEVKVIDQNNNEYLAENNSSEADLTYKVNNSDGNKELKLFCKSSNEIKTFIINYTIENAAVKYSDVGQLYWNFYELNDEVDNIKEGSLNISLENEAFQNDTLSYTIYGDGSIKASDSPNLISISFKDLTSLIGIKLNFQKDFLSVVLQKEQTSLEAEKAEKTKNILIAAAFIAVGAIIFLIFFIKHSIYKKALNEYRMGYSFISSEYLVNPPKDISPAIVDYLFNSCTSDEILFPTLFYLSFKGYYSLSTKNLPKKDNEEYEFDCDLIFTRNTFNDMPKEKHLAYLIQLLKKYENNNKLSIIQLAHTLKDDDELEKFTDAFDQWSDIINQECRNNGFFIKIKGHEILTNEFYNEKLQWECYKTYLLKLADNQFKMTLDTPDYPLIYGTALDIEDETIEKLIDLMPKKDLTSNAYVRNYFAYNMFFTSISTDSASSSSDISSGSSFSGGGGGGSGAF